MMLPKTPILALLLSLINLGASQKCLGQSCQIAALSGSTEESFAEILKGTNGGKQPQGSDGAGKKCITKYYKQLGLKAPEGIAGISRAALLNTMSFGPGVVQPTLEKKSASAKSSAEPQNEAPDYSRTSDVEKRQGCKPHAVLYARGTLEGGTMGSSVGPVLSGALGGSWHVEGIRYNADIAGDNCIGFPGGLACVNQLAAYSSKCPESKLFVSGYSQGAMVARICAAFSKDDVKKKIKGVVVFGDPFNGASIKGFPSDGIKTFCSAADGVCGGKFQITPAHLAYSGNGSPSQAAKWMNERAKA